MKIHPPPPEPLQLLDVERREVILYGFHTRVECGQDQCCGSEINFFSDPDPTLTLISDPDSDPACL